MTISEDRDELSQWKARGRRRSAPIDRLPAEQRAALEAQAAEIGRGSDKLWGTQLRNLGERVFNELQDDLLTQPPTINTTITWDQPSGRYVAHESLVGRDRSRTLHLGSTKPDPDSVPVRPLVSFRRERSVSDMYADTRVLRLRHGDVEPAIQRGLVAIIGEAPRSSVEARDVLRDLRLDPATREQVIELAVAAFFVAPSQQDQATAETAIVEARRRGTTSFTRLPRRSRP